MTHFGPVTAEGAAGVRPRRGLRALGPRGQPLPRRALHAVLRQRRPRARGARRRGRRADARARLRARRGTWSTRRRSSSPRASPASRPGDLDRVFFTSGGSESVESALKLARSLPPAARRAARGRRSSRASSPTTARPRARSPRPGLPSVRTPFEPLAPGGCHVPHTDGYRTGPAATRCGPRTRSSTGSAFEGPETVAAVILEPVQNSGGCLVPPDGYFQRVREICDRHGVLLISDDTICSWGRLGTWFGGQRFGYVPDLITTAKGITSAYAPMGAVIVSERVAAPFLEQDGELRARAHVRRPPGRGRRRAGQHRPDRARGPARPRPRATSRALRDALEGLRDIPLVGDVRGAGYFWGIELVADRETKAPFAPEAGEGGRRRRSTARSAPPRADLPRGRPRLPGDPARPAAVAGPAEFEEIAGVLRAALTEAAVAHAAVTAPPACGAACARSTCSPTPAGPDDAAASAWSTSPAGSASTRARPRARCARSPSTASSSATRPPAPTALGPRVFAYAALVAERRLLRAAPARARASSSRRSASART